MINSKRSKIFIVMLFVFSIVMGATVFAKEESPILVNEAGQTDFIDISSHNGSITVEQFQILKEKGVKGIVVKLSEGDSFYANPLAKLQIDNAEKAGLVVSVYHYAHFSNEEEAKKEATFFIKQMKDLNLPKTTLMVNDFEDSNTLTNTKTNQANTSEEVTKNILTFTNVLQETGYPYVVTYSYENFIQKNLRGNLLGRSSLWMANYLHATTPDIYPDNAAWQWTSSGKIEDVVATDANTSSFDLNKDYSGLFVTKLPEIKTGFIQKNPKKVFLLKNLESYADASLSKKVVEEYKKEDILNITAIFSKADGTTVLLLENGSYISGSKQDVLSVEENSVQEKLIEEAINSQVKSEKRELEKKRRMAEKQPKLWIDSVLPELSQKIEETELPSLLPFQK